jgi:hypothetical protein
MREDADVPLRLDGTAGQYSPVEREIKLALEENGWRRAD